MTRNATLDRRHASCQTSRLQRFEPLFDRTDSPLGFEAGDANLFRYVGNSPADRVDPSGLFELPLPEWREYPSYDPSGGILRPNAGNNTGNPTFQKWLRDDPERATRFVKTIQEAYRFHVGAAADIYSVPEALLFGTIIPEMINFSWADYQDLGSSTGPGQLTRAILDYYNARVADECWEDGTARTGYRNAGYYEWTSKSLGGARLSEPNVQRGLPILRKGAVLDQQLAEIALAASGGGKLDLGNGKSIIVPPMSDEFAAWAGGIANPRALDKQARKDDPAIVAEFFGNGIAPLVALLVSMNRNNPGATGNTQGRCQYETDFGIKGPQATIAHSLFRDGHFRMGKDGTFIWSTEVERGQVR